MRRRLLLAEGRLVDARWAHAPDETAPPWLRAEDTAYCALAAAASGDGPCAIKLADQAEAICLTIEVATTCGVARAVAAKTHYRGLYEAQLRRVARRLADTGVVDPVVTRIPALRETLASATSNANDIALAAACGLSVTPTAPTFKRLSPREEQVLALVGAGLPSRAIAQALYISESTVKAHVRHVFEKLGVHTRAAAVAAFAAINRTPGQ
jgi:DNA-binding CsgD family transcriptional regulator